MAGLANYTVQTTLTIDDSKFDAGLKQMASGLEQVRTIGVSDFDQVGTSTLKCIDNLLKLGEAGSQCGHTVGEAMSKMNGEVESFKAKSASAKAEISELKTALNGLATVHFDGADGVSPVVKSMLENVKVTIAQLNGEEGKLRQGIISLGQAIGEESIAESKSIMYHRELITTNNQLALSYEKLTGKGISVIGTWNANAMASHKVSLLEEEQIGVNSRLALSFNSLDSAIGKNNALESKSILTAREKIVADTELANTNTKLASTYGRLSSTLMSSNGALQKTALENAKVSSSANGVVSSTTRASNGLNNYTNHANRSTKATGLLSKSLSGLRMVGSFVGTMFAFTLVDGLIQSVQATLEAKSEMDSYFQQMKMNEGEVNSFTKSLNQCVETFPKMNKYQLGETIASLGVEFKMTNAEMEKSMKVVPMIVNEYLRAGRTVQEADLAVKDIAQGQFQRLSRETGVGKEDLTAAGWSGDNKDINSLMEALKKVGESRHWDAFAEKATSLSDVLQITENRISEWATDLLNVATPMVVNGFNAMVGAMSGAIGFFHSQPPFVQWGIEAGVIMPTLIELGNVISNHLKPAIKGMLDSRLASATGLDASIAKEKGYASALAESESQMIISKNATRANYDAELLNASATEKSAMETTVETAQRELNVTQIEAEEIALNGLNESRTTGISASAGMTNQLNKERIAGLSTTQAYLTQKLGLNSATTATQGLGASFIETYSKQSKLMKGMTALQYSSLSTTGKIKAMSKAILGNSAFMGKTAGLLAVVAAVMLIGHYLQTSTSAMARFNEVLENGQQNIDDSKTAVSGYQSQLKSLNSELNKEKANGQSTVHTRDEITKATQRLNKAQQTLYSEEQAYNQAKGIQQNAKTDKEYSELQNMKARARMLKQNGLISEQQYNSMNKNGFDAVTVQKQFASAQQKYGHELDRNNERLTNYGKILKYTGQSEEDQQATLQERGNLMDDLANKQYEWNTAKSGTEKLQAGLEMFLDYMFIFFDEVWTRLQIFGHWFIDIGNWIIGAVGNTVSFVQGMWGNTVSFFQWVYTELAGGVAWLQGAWDNSVKAIGNAGAWLQGAWGNTVSFFQNIWNKLASGVNWLKGAWGNTLKWIGDRGKWLQGAWGNTVAFFQNIWNKLASGVNWTKTKVHEFQKELDKTKIPEALKTLKSWYDKISNTVKNAVHWLKQFNAENNKVKVPGDGNNGNTGIPGVSWSYKFQLPKVLTNLLPETSSASDPTKYYNSGKQSGEARTKGFKAGDKTQLTQQQIDNANTNGTNNTKYHNSGKSSGNNWVNGLRSGIVNAPNVVRSTLNKAGSFIRSTGSSWVKNAKTTGKKFSSGLHTGFNQAKGFVNKALSPIRGIINNHGKKWKSNSKKAGKDSSTGLKNGINPMHNHMRSEMEAVLNAVISKGRAIINAARSLGSSITHAFANLGLGRHSPGDLYKAMFAELGSVNDAFSQKKDIILQNAKGLGTEVTGAFKQNTTLTAQTPTLQGQNNPNAISNQQTQSAVNNANVIAQTNQQSATSSLQSYTQIRKGAGQTLTSMGTQASGVFNGIAKNNTNYLDKVKKDTNSGYKQTQNYTKKNLTSMNNTTKSTTDKMVSAWNHMRGNIVNSANQIQVQSYAKFSSLHRSIASFYNQLASAHFGSGLAMGTGSGIPYIGSRHTTHNLSFGSSGSSVTKERYGRYYGTNETHSNSKRYLELLDMRNPDMKELVQLRESVGCNDDSCVFGSDTISNNYQRIKTTADKWSISDPYMLGIQLPMHNHVYEWDDGRNKRITYDDFEPLLRHLLTVRGFRNPDSYEYYANSKYSTQQVWDGRRCNCWDGAEEILALANMMGLGGSMIHGSWNGQGHMGAMIGGKLYDMTQFQKHGVFRGTPGVSFGTKGGTVNSPAPHGISSTEANVPIQKTVVNIDMTDATIIGKEDWQNRMDEIAVKAIYRENGVSPVTGY